MKFILPVFFVAVFIGVLVELYIPESIVYALLGKNPLFAIPLAAIIGVILPIPRYATYPLAFALFSKGVGFGVIFALLAGEVICESILGDILEIKYFGIKFYSTRMVLSTVFIIIGGFLIEYLL